MIEASSLKKKFGEQWVVTDVSFAAANGRITGLLGPNGAGKSTSLRMVSGLIVPTAGSIKIDGLESGNNQKVSVKRSLGVLCDASGLYPRLTVREHLEYSAGLHGLSGDQLEAAVARALDLLEIEDLAERRTEGFSHGERRKVELARALVHDPQNILLDEPTNGLDVPSIRVLRRTVRRLAELGKCVLFSSHVMQEISALCDQVVIIARGRVLATGSPSDLQKRSGQVNLEEAFVHLIGGEEGLN
jgi:sodium transport system ATP-binding protein